MDGEFPIRYSSRLRWLFAPMLLGAKHSEVRLNPGELHVRMGWAFDAHITRSAIHTAARYKDVPWAIGVHTNMHGTWLVHGSATGVVDLRLDPPARGRMALIPIKIKRLGLALQDADGFLATLGVPAA
jgi:hypothetical protein